MSSVLKILHDPKVAQALKIGGVLVALGAVGLIIYMAVWAVNSKLSQALAPYIGWLKAILTSISNHPTAWLAAVGGLIGVAIGGYMVYELYKYIEGRRAMKAEIARDKAAAAKSGKPEHYTAEQEKAAATDTSEFYDSIVEQARVIKATGGDTFSSAEIETMRTQLRTAERLLAKSMEATKRAIASDTLENGVAAEQAADEYMKQRVNTDTLIRDMYSKIIK